MSHLPPLPCTLKDENLVYYGIYKVCKVRVVQIKVFLDL